MRKSILLLFLVQGLWLTVYPQYWQQEVNYRIDVSLNDREHSLDGFARIEYINNSPDTLKYIWFHLWPNAYRNDNTAFSDQLLENGNTKFYFSDKDQKGYINRLDFKVGGITAQTADHPQHIDITQVLLPSPLAPGQKTTITTAFHVKLPYNFSRGGHDGESYQVTQWYPKPAVYDSAGWHPMPYLDQGEFYSEFGSYEVSITLPRNYVVAATGELQQQEEKEWLKTRRSFDWSPPSQKVKSTGQAEKNIQQIFPPSERELKTLLYKQSRIHDFAWFADKRFIVETDTCLLSTGKIIEVASYYTPGFRKNWSGSLQYAKDGTRHYSDLVGEYPFNVVSVVQGPESFGGGMEYPTITVISPGGSAKDLDNTIAHEIGHNWFYGILASNERDHPWMDEGINSYFDDLYYHKKYGPRPQLERIIFETKAIHKTDQPIELESEKFSETNYYLTAYNKTAEWLRYVAAEWGTNTLHTAIQEYYRRWQFRHPSPAAFREILQEVKGREADTVLQLLKTRGTLPNQQRKGTRAAFIFNWKKLADYLRNPSKDLILFGPAAGINAYDKLMVGLFVTNIKLPPSRFQFLAAPLYGTGSDNFGGMGLAYYSFYPDHIFSKIELGVSGAAFTIDRFQPDSGDEVHLSFQKIVPGIRFTFREKNPRSTLHRYFQFKSFLVGEDRLRFFRDSIFNPPDTIVIDRYGTKRENRTLNQLVFAIEDNRVLYPYRGELKIEQATDFIRTAFTGKYFFNYPKEGGLDLRFFAGKFIYTSQKTIAKQFATDRYHLNMTGPNGFEDYTYSDYFIGRNKFEGFASQQIMMKDGGFKVRTDLLADKVGRTDDWLLSLNFSSTIPSGMNPLSMLPVKIPLKLFLDIGTSAEAWEKDAEGDRFLFDAGLQLSFLKETIHIYLPLIYSRVFRDYIQSTIEKKGRLWKTISFTIDISNFSLRKLNRNLDL